MSILKQIKEITLNIKFIHTFIFLKIRHICQLPNHGAPKTSRTHQEFTNFFSENPNSQTVITEIPDRCHRTVDAKLQNRRICQLPKRRKPIEHVYYT